MLNLALCVSFSVSSEYIPAHTECSQGLGFFFLFLLMNLPRSLSISGFSLSLKFRS